MQIVIGRDVARRDEDLKIYIAGPSDLDPWNCYLRRLLRVVSGQATHYRCRLSATMHPELLEYMVHMVLYRRDFDAQRSCNFFVGKTSLDEFEDTRLSTGEAFNCSGCMSFGRKGRNAT